MPRSMANPGTVVNMCILVACVNLHSPLVIMHLLNMHTLVAVGEHSFLTVLLCIAMAGCNCVYA